MYSLADVDGVLCVAFSAPMDAEPVLVTNYWPTALKTADFINFHEIGVGSLALVRVRNPSTPGMFLCNLESDEPLRSWNTSVYLKDLGKTQSIKVDKMPIPAPTVRWPVKYEAGSWWVQLSSGWKKRT